MALPTGMGENPGIQAPPQEAEVRLHRTKAKLVDELRTPGGK